MHSFHTLVSACDVQGEGKSPGIKREALPQTDMQRVGNGLDGSRARLLVPMQGGLKLSERLIHTLFHGRGHFPEEGKVGPAGHLWLREFSVP